MARKVKRIRFNDTYFDSGIPKWEAGKHYPVTEDTQRQVRVGIAEEITVDAAEAEAMDGQLQLDVAANPDAPADDAAPPAGNAAAPAGDPAADPQP